jgi:hypothetical protein
MQVQIERCGHCQTRFQVVPEFPWRANGFCCEACWKYAIGDRGNDPKEMAEIARTASIRRQASKDFIIRQRTVEKRVRESGLFGK